MVNRDARGRFVSGEGFDPNAPTPIQVQQVLDNATERVVRRVALRAWQVLAFATPVKTGFARGSLEPTTGTPSTATRERPDDIPEAERQATANFNANEAEIERIAQTYILRQGSVFLTYTAPYVVFLNMGTSSQAPEMFIEQGIETALRSLSELRL